MSLTLGEKLRQAREERGISLSEVAEQTRISPHYIQSIENDDYKPLPGGIFNKGFVKSFAKYVEIDEQEALLDYSRLIAEKESQGEEQLKTYRPEVLTDDRTRNSMIPTVIGAVIILGLMSAGILFLVNYLRSQPNTPAANVATANTNSNGASSANSNSSTSPANVPDMATLKVEFKALTLPVSLSASNDGKLSSNVVAAGSTATFEPKESLKLSYSRSLAQSVQLTINGKAISLPAVPLNPKRTVIEFDITKETLGQIWQSGAISTEVPAAMTNTNATIAATTTSATPRPTPVPKPSIAANTAPAKTPAKPDETPKPTPRPVVIIKSAPKNPH